MTDKFDFYDLLGVLIPGALLVSVVTLGYPDVAMSIPMPAFPEAFAVIVLLSLAILAGHVLQALASLFEPLLDRSWGGRISTRVFQADLGERYLPSDVVKRVSAKLDNLLGGETSNHTKFLLAVQIAETGGSSRVARFGALYAYFRVLLVLSVASLPPLLHSMTLGNLRGHSVTEKIALTISLLSLILLLWNRTRQRAIYYVREVLLSALKTLTDKQESK